MKKIVFACITVAFCLTTLSAEADHQPKKPKKPKKGKNNKSRHHTPNSVASLTTALFAEGLTDGEGSSLMTPTGWGSSGTYAFASIGGTPRQVYSVLPDMIAQAGVSVGDSRKLVSVMGIVNIQDVSKFRAFSADFIASRSIDKNSSISIGGIDLFGNRELTDASSSLYFAYSRNVKNSKISYTIGAGTGRFLETSLQDQKIGGKGEYGTGVFANVSYNLMKNVNVAAEWTGTNLCFSTSAQFKRNWPVVSLGVADITRFSGDQPTFLLTVGQPIFFNKRKG